MKRRKRHSWVIGMSIDVCEHCHCNRKGKLYRSGAQTYDPKPGSDDSWTSTRPPCIARK